MFKSNTSGSRVDATAKFHSSKFMNVNKPLYKWWILACSKIIFPGSMQLIEKAKEMVE